MIYLDNAATTKIYKKAQDARTYAENEAFANSSSLHSFGLKSSNLLRESREIIASIIGSNPDEIYFTKGATEANNIAISSMSGENNIAITSAIEHSSVYDSFNNYPYKDIIYLKNDRYGFVDLDDLKEKLSKDVKLVSIIYANNEIGTIQDIRKISDIVKSFDKNILIHIDATQALGKISCDVGELKVDLMSFSAHKFHGPKGVGGLYVRKEILSKIKAVLHGGHQQVVSSGTDNHPAIYAMATALKEQIDADEFNYVNDLNQYMRTLIDNNISDYIFNTPGESYSPYILSVGFANIKSEVLLHMLEDNDIYVSSGSACSKGNNNRILEALDVDDKYSDGVIRFSFAGENTKEELEETVKVLKESIDEIRRVM
ncbi:cysteine desulfurase family protein [uncultured Anaerococcus sp.]|uniref:cysteine desulfurase family protein n=1 Tax=uncultured Anaerococcus sp. TaxID=293428 RepID=UPI0025F3DDB7|nr:cysteine desulfurase family protein [uncultured Anaerococcus sp.]